VSSSKTAGILAPSERERVLRAVAELCAERGYRETTAAAIIERAGSSEPAFRKMFGGVEECMVAALNAITAQTLAEVSSTYSVDLSEWDSGMLGIKAILELMAAHPSFAYLGYIGARQMATPRVAEVYRTATQMLSVMIERLWEYSELDVQPRHAAGAALGGAEAVVRAKIVAGRGSELPSLLPGLIYGASVPFLGQEEAMRLARRGGELLAGTEWAS
jgi:AcrR family transcriptional regulator